MKIILALLFASLAHAQPRTHGITGGAAPVDFSGASTTKPMKVGTSLPGTCSVGELFFKSDATAGQNIYECASTNTWTQDTGGGGGGLADGCTVTTTSTTITVASGCTFKIGVVKYTLSSPAVWTTSGTPSVTAFVYGSNDGTTSQVTIGTTSGSGTCDADCTSQTLGSTGFPAGSVPIATVPLTAGVVGSATDVRNSLGGYKALAGTGLGKTTNADGSETFNVTASYVDTTDSRLIVSCSDAGASDAYACTPSPTIAAYVIGGKYQFVANTANVGAATINFNSLGAKTIKKMNNNLSEDLATGDVCAGQWVSLVYNGTNMMMDSPPCTPASGGSGFTKFANTTSTPGSAVACSTGTWVTVDSFSLTGLTVGTMIDAFGQFLPTGGNAAGYDMRFTLDGIDLQNTAGLGATACSTTEACTMAGRINVGTGLTLTAVYQTRPSNSNTVLSYSRPTAPAASSTLAWQVRCTTGDTMKMDGMSAKVY